VHNATRVQDSISFDHKVLDLLLHQPSRWGVDTGLIVFLTYKYSAQNVFGQTIMQEICVLGFCSSFPKATGRLEL
jgi:hypothetical protein